jgi:hypothetical protein
MPDFIHHSFQVYVHMPGNSSTKQGTYQNLFITLLKCTCQVIQALHRVHAIQALKRVHVVQALNREHVSQALNRIPYI